MTEQSITQLQARWQEEMSLSLADWEGHFFREACRQAQQAARAWLEKVDAWLLEHKPQGWQVVGMRKRTLVTRFGEVTFRRRLYRDEAGRYRFLLDEVLGLPAHQAASPAVMEAVVVLASAVAFAQVAAILALLTAGVLSGSTVWRVVQRVGQRVHEAEEAEVERVFGQGQAPQRRGQRVAKRLYVEADGVMVRQRTRQGRTRWKELRLGVAYDDSGMERVYLQGSKRPDFWEGASVVWGEVWDWGRVQEVVVHGDDAHWIDGSRMLHTRVVRQWDGFHVARAAYRAAGSALGKALSQALQAGDRAEVRRLWAKVPKPGKKASKRRQAAWRWLEAHLNDLRMVRWWRQVGRPEGAEVETLGHIESVVGAVVAQRMKGQRRHGSPSGAQHMVKVLQVVWNREVDRWCTRPGPKAVVESPQMRPSSRAGRHSRHDPGDWLQVRVPFLHGPIPTEPSPCASR